MSVDTRCVLAEKHKRSQEILHDVSEPHERLRLVAPGQDEATVKKCEASAHGWVKGFLAVGFDVKVLFFPMVFGVCSVDSVEWLDNFQALGSAQRTLRKPRHVDISILRTLHMRGTLDAEPSLS